MKRLAFGARRLVFGLLLLGLPALAQTYLLKPDGTTAQDVRGTLSGNARGYEVSVEFLVEAGADPYQGTLDQPGNWDGKFSACAPDCTTFFLSGWDGSRVYSNAVFDVYDQGNNLRGRAAVNTTPDQQGRPQSHRVQYVLWPLQGTKVWMASPDNPVPLEAGGWLHATRPGGTRERYRYPGMESYQPPATGSFFAGLSEADRDVARKSLISSLADLRAFYDRQALYGTIWFFVPEVSPWTLTLAQEWASRRSGQARFVVPENTARGYCSTSYWNDPRFYVLPRKDLPKERSIAVIWPPQGQSLPGAAMAGRYLVDRPDWQETDYVSFTTALIPTTQGLPEAKAQVWGYISQANLKARVQFKELAFEDQPTRQVSLTFPEDWDGTFSYNVGKGMETFRVSKDQAKSEVRDAQNNWRGWAYVVHREEYETNFERYVQKVQGYDYSEWKYLGAARGRTSPEGWRFFLSALFPMNLWGYYTTYECSRDTDGYYYCKLKDDDGRYRGLVGIWPSQSDYYIKSMLVYYLKRVGNGYELTAYLRGWVEAWRYASDNDRPVEAGGYVTAEGKRYRIPSLEGYLMPTSKDIEAVEGDPYVTYITRSLLPDRNPYAGLGTQAQGQGAGTWYKPLMTWCQEAATAGSGTGGGTGSGSGGGSGSGSGAGGGTGGGGTGSGTGGGSKPGTPGFDDPVQGR